MRVKKFVQMFNWKPRVKDSGSYIRLKEFYTSGRYKE